MQRRKGEWDNGSRLIWYERYERYGERQRDGGRGEWRNGTGKRTEDREEEKG